MLQNRNPVPAYCLSIHARYRCAHAGECCTAGWPIPAEPPLIDVLSRGRLGPAWSPDRAFEESDGPDGRCQVLRTKDGQACVFYEDDRRNCGIHRQVGEEVLPMACRNFPRITLHDRRGMFVTLSHFCPTAAALLYDDGEIAIVEAPSGLSLNGAAEGLDATAVLPPLLRPGMLTDVEGYAAWEGAAVATFNDRGSGARDALAVIAAATDIVCAWQPGGDSLATRVSEAFEGARNSVDRQRSVPSPLERGVKGFLAAHLFANWSAYQGDGLAAVVRAVDNAHVTVVRELLGRGSLGEGGLGCRSLGEGTSRATFIAAVRAADFRLRHSRTDVRPRSLPSLRVHRHPVG